MQFCVAEYLTMDRLTSCEVFVAIAERSSLTAAAEALHMSRAMVSRHLVEMERWVGVRLINRSTRSISLTSGGQEALERCRQMLAHARDLSQTLADCSQPVRGQLRISFSHSLGRATLAAAVAAFHQDHQQVRVECIVDNRPLHLVDDRIDLAVRIDSSQEGSVVARPLGKCASVLCASPGYLERCGVPQSPADLAGHDCSAYSLSGPASWTLLDRRRLVTCEVPVAGHLSANDSLFLLAVTLQGGGITMQPLLSVAKYLEAGQLVRVLPDFEPPSLDVCAIYASRSNVAPQIRAMLDHLVRWFEQGCVKELLLGPPSSHEGAGPTDPRQARSSKALLCAAN